MFDSLKARVREDLKPITMTHVFRDANGVSKGEFSDEAMLKILASNYGSWRPYKDTSGVATSCYEFHTDCVLLFVGMKVFFWKGDKLIKKHP